jgi:hypothetical protein
MAVGGGDDGAVDPGTQHPAGAGRVHPIVRIATVATAVVLIAVRIGARAAPSASQHWVPLFDWVVLLAVASGFLWVTTDLFGTYDARAGANAAVDDPLAPVRETVERLRTYVAPGAAVLVVFTAFHLTGGFDDELLLAIVVAVVALWSVPRFLLLWRITSASWTGVDPRPAKVEHVGRSVYRSTARLVIEDATAAEGQLVTTVTCENDDDGWLVGTRCTGLILSGRDGLRRNICCVAVPGAVGIGRRRR